MRCSAVEDRAHELLENQRVHPKREFFRVSVQEAIGATTLASIEIAGISTWSDSEEHFLRSGDRLALTAQAGQIFALISYRSVNDLLVTAPMIMDIWQAHADGDVLEIFGAESASYIAGFSDNDPESDQDPVPYLDRQGLVLNGSINGREKMLAGERLVWVPAPEDTRSHGVIFESLHHCQILSRTWKPKITKDGLPLLMTHFTHDHVWSAATTLINQALAPPIPRTWTPRQDRDETWEAIGSAPRRPEDWVPKLKPLGKRRG